MRPTREGRIADAILQMRNPLAGVALAASQLAREALTPAARDLACGISEAVSRIDESIEDSLRVLRRDRANAREPEDCTSVLDSIRVRMNPVLQAHSIRWVASEEKSETPVLADRDAAERGALALLRAGIALAGARGCVSLSFASSDECEGHSIVLEVDPGPKPGAQRDDVLDGPSNLALRTGGSFQLHRTGESIRAVLRLGTVRPA